MTTFLAELRQTVFFAAASRAGRSPVYWLMADRATSCMDRLSSSALWQQDLGEFVQ